VAGDAHQTVSVELRAETEGFRKQLRVSREDWEAWRRAADQADTQARETGRRLDTLGREAADAARHADALGDQTQRAARRVDTLGDRARQSARQVDTLGRSASTVRGLLGGLALTAGALGVVALGREVVESWVDYEAALVGVGKTADVVGTELTALGEAVSALAVRPEMGATTLELLSIAQAAGQLGVAGAANIEHFTATIAQLQGASDLVGAEGATALARILTVTDEGTAVVDRLASTIVALGNSYAATESEITRATTTVAQATSIYDVGAAQAAGLATALTAMGVQAELAGGAVGRAMLAISEALRDGGAELRALEAITGATAEALRAAWATDALSVFEDLVTGLARVRAEGGDVAAALQAIGLEAGEDVRVLGALASGGDTLARALADAARAWAENTALTDEAGRAGETAAAQFRAFGQVIWQTGVTIGEALTPALLAAAQDIAAMIQAARDSGDLAEWAEWLGERLVDVADAAMWAADHADLLIAAFAAMEALDFAAWLAEVSEGVSALAHGLGVLRAAALAHPLLAAAAAATALGVAAYYAAEESREQRQAIEDLHAALDRLKDKTDESRRSTDAETAASRESTRALLANAQARLEVVKAEIAFWDANDPNGLRARLAPGYQAGRDENLAAHQAEVKKLEGDIARLQDKLASLNAPDPPAAGDTKPPEPPDPPDPPDPPTLPGGADAWAQWVAQTRLATAAALDLAAAQDQGVGAIQAAQVAAEAESVALQHGAQHRAEAIALLTKEAAARQALAVAQTVADLDRQIAAERALAAASLLGRDAIQAANIERQAADTLTRLLIEDGTAEAQVIRDRVQATHDWIEAQQKAAPLGEAKDRLKALEAEAEGLAEVTQQRKLSRAELETIQSLTERGIALTSEQAREELRLADAVAKQTRATERARAAATDWADGATQAIHAYQVAALDAAAVTEDAFTGVFRSWEDSLTDFMAEFDFSFKSAKTLIEDLGDAVLSEIARIAARSMVSSIAGGIGSILGLTGAGGTAAGGGGSAGQAGAGGGLGDLLGLGSLADTLFSGGTGWGTSLVTGSIGQSLGLSTPATIFWNGGGTQVLTGLAGVPTNFGASLAGGLNAAPWGAVGSIGASMLGFSTGHQLADMGVSSLGAIGGGMLGAGIAAGSAGGPIGAIVGAFASMVLGDLIGGLFGQALPNISQTLDWSDGTFSQGEIDGRLVDEADRQKWGDAVSAAVIAPMQSVFDALDGIGFAPDFPENPYALNAKHGQIGVFGGVAGETYYDEDDLDAASVDIVQRIAQDTIHQARMAGESLDDLAGVMAVLEGSTAETGAEMATHLAIAADWRGAIDDFVGGLTDGVAAQRAAIEASAAEWATSVEAFIGPALEVGEILEDAGQLETGQAKTDIDAMIRALLGMGEAEDSLTAVETAVMTVDAQLSALAEVLVDLGWSAEEAGDYVDQLRDELVGQTADAFDDATRATIRSLSGEGYRNDLDDLGEGYDTRLSDARLLGADTGLVLEEAALAVAAAVDGLSEADIRALMTEYQDSAAVMAGLELALRQMEDAAREAAHQAEVAAREAAAALAASWTARLAAANDNDSLESVLAAWDAAAQQEWIDAAANPYADLALLEETLAAERRRAIEEYYEAEAAERETALREARAYWEDLADYARSVGESIRDAALDIQLSAAVDGGTDRAVLDAAEELFLGALGTIANSDDEDAVRQALDHLGEWGRAYAEASSDYWGTQSQHYVNLAFIQEALNSVADALGAADPAEGDAEMAALLASIRENTGALGPLAKAEQLSDQLAVIFGGAGSTSYLYQLMTSSDMVAQYTDEIANLMAEFLEEARAEDDDWRDDRQWAAEGYEEHIPANYALAQGTGYEGDFGDGGWAAWIAQQSRDVQMAAANILLTYGQADRISWASSSGTVVDDYEAANDALVSATGFPGEFGGGAWNAWIAQQSSEIKYLARQILYAYGQSERVNFAAGGWVRGPGGWTDDLVPANLSNEEFVLRGAAATYIATAAPGLLEGLNDNQVSIAPLPPPSMSSMDIPPAPNVVPFAGGGAARDEDALIDRVERLEAAMDAVAEAIHSEASAGRRTDGGLTQALVDELRGLRRDLRDSTDRAALSARAAVGGRRR